MNFEQQKASGVGVLNSGLMNAINTGDWKRFWRCRTKIEALGCKPIPYRRSEWPTAKDAS